METLIVRIDSDDEGYYRARVMTRGDFHCQQFIGTSQENAFMGLSSILRNLGFSGNLCLEKKNVL